MERQGYRSCFPMELTEYKLMKLYYIVIPTISHIDSQMALGTILYNIFTYSIPWKPIENEFDQLFN